MSSTRDITDERAAVRELPEPPFVLVDGAGWAGDGGRVFADPTEILTERDGTFVSLPSGHAVDPVAWLRDRADGCLAGYLGYEFGWTLLDVRAQMPPSAMPRIWVGVFEEPSLALPGTEPAAGVLGELGCTLRADEYRERVARCVDDIWNGELFEINFTARFDAAWSSTPTAFYETMRRDSRGDWFGMVHAGDFAVASVSPEAFVSVQEGRVRSRPIKGTRRRAQASVADRRVAAELLASEKDRAENVMIVDLMRNDLTRVCRPGSVRATEVCKLETFAGVHHLVSTVEGELAADRIAIDALLECFPAGSITGAPKLRAMELAAEYEHGARGAYTGSLFVARPGELRSNVLIRTATLCRQADSWAVSYGAGGAVVAESDPESEWQETLAKTAPLRRMVTASEPVKEAR